jgi:putative hemolysin
VSSHTTGGTVGTAPQRPHLEPGIAHTPDDVLAAQRLRYRVFGQEMGATLPEAHLGLDRDSFDERCRHLIVRDRDTGQVVGTYRLLDARGAELTGGFYAETEFELSQIRAHGTRLVEVGRACIDPAYRTGATIAMLLSALTAHVVDEGYEHVIGCASIPIAGDPAGAAALCRRLLGTHGTPPDWRVTPYRPFAVRSIAPRPETSLPPLLKAYLRMGARVGGQAAWDPDFDTADLFIVLPIAELTTRYARRFLRAA